MLNATTLTAQTSYRSALETVASQFPNPVNYWVDNLRRVMMLLTNVNYGLAPFNFAATPGGGEVAASAIEASWDFTEFANRVYITSTTPDGVGWWNSEVSWTEDPTAYSSVPVDITVTADGSTTQGAMQLYGDGTLKARQAGSAPTVTVTKEGVFGWELGQRVTMNYPQLGLDAGAGQYFTITAYRLTFVTPTDPVYELTLNAAHFFGTGGNITALQTLEPTNVITHKRAKKKPKT
jgi:hypothetical protein